MLVSFKCKIVGFERYGKESLLFLMLNQAYVKAFSVFFFLDQPNSYVL